MSSVVGPTMRLGLAQVTFDDAHDAHHRSAVTSLALDELAGAGVEVAVLPELTASGYIIDYEHLKAVAEANDATGPVLRTWVASAKRHSMAIIGGYCELDRGKLFNSSVAIGADGEICGHYRKLHLFADEHDVFALGDLGVPVFELLGQQVAMLICYDLRFPESVRLAALLGAEVVFVPTAWVSGFDRRPPGSTRQIGQIEAAVSHADLNQVFIACADQVGSVGRTTFLGRSVVIDPYGEVVVGPLSESDPELAVVEIDLAHCLAARERGTGISPRDNRRGDVYGWMLGYVARDNMKAHP